MSVCREMSRMVLRLPSCVEVNLFREWLPCLHCFLGMGVGVVDLFCCPVDGVLLHKLGRYP